MSEGDWLTEDRDALKRADTCNHDRGDNVLTGAVSGLGEEKPAPERDGDPTSDLASAGLARLSSEQGQQ